MMDCNRKLHYNALPTRIICCQIAGSQIPIALHGGATTSQRFFFVVA
jgi:hypothetical protein